MISNLISSMKTKIQLTILEVEVLKKEFLVFFSNNRVFATLQIFQQLKMIKTTERMLSINLATIYQNPFSGRFNNTKISLEILLKFFSINLSYRVNNQKNQEC